MIVLQCLFYSDGGWNSKPEILNRAILCDFILEHKLLSGLWDIRSKKYSNRDKRICCLQKNLIRLKSYAIVDYDCDTRLLLIYFCLLNNIYILLFNSADKFEDYTVSYVNTVNIYIRSVILIVCVQLYTIILYVYYYCVRCRAVTLMRYIVQLCPSKFHLL